MDINNLKRQIISLFFLLHSLFSINCITFFPLPDMEKKRVLCTLFLESTKLAFTVKIPAETSRQFFLILFKDARGTEKEGKGHGQMSAQPGPATPMTEPLAKQETTGYIAYNSSGLEAML